MKLKRKNIIILIVTLVIIIAISAFLGIKPARETMISLFQKEEIKKGIDYEVYSNEDDILKILIIVTDEENGIEEIEYPDGNKLYCNGKKKVTIDYIITTDDTYTFKYKSTTGKIETKNIKVDENFRENIFEFKKLQEISTEKDYSINYNNKIIESKFYYSIGTESTDWKEVEGEDIINIDEYDAFHKERINEDKTITINLKKEDNYGNKVEISYKLEEFNVPENLYNKEEQILEGESIIACIRDHDDIKSGNYTLEVNGEQYPAEIYNYEDEKVNYITDKNLGTTENDNRMLIMKYKGNLNIEANNIITAQARKKGMFIYVEGELTNNGEISMTARGAKAQGQNVYLLKYKSGQYEYVPAEGAAGAAGVSVSGNGTQVVLKNGNKGNNAIKNRETGGGGSGGAGTHGCLFWGNPQSTSASSGAGAMGTSYSGGTGGGYGYRYLYSRSNTWPQTMGSNGSAGQANGGAGGAGYSGGTGNPGGTPGGTSGTGGLLIIYADSLNNKGEIDSKGTDSNGSGGASGGGSVNIFYKELIEQGNINATGGNVGSVPSGGNGSVTIQSINLKIPKITLENINETKIKINIQNENSNMSEMLYDYYINDRKFIENTDSISETINIGKGTYKVYVILKYNDIELKSESKEIELLGKPLQDIYKKFNKYIYIDAVNGNDTEGNGSPEKPYATLDKIADSGIIEKEYTYGIILKDGTYTLSTKIFSLQCNKSINIIGNKNHTTLNVGGMFNNKVGGSKEYSVNFNRLIWNFTESSTQGLLCYNSITFENVVFINNKNTDNWGFFFPGHAEYFEYRNCIAIGSYNAGLRGGGCVHKVKNCYGKFVPGFGSCDWQEQTNYKTTTPQVDSETYIITEDKSKWKDVGTGEDLDGSPADLGVYGGEYSWEYETDLK